MTDEVTPRKDLRDFLRAARAKIDPAELGLVTLPGRRSHGLQQADVAALLRVSRRWYNGFECGTMTASETMLDSIAGLLRLTPAERVHLYLLATGHDPAPATVQPPEDASAVLARLVHQMGDLAIPALVTDIAWNLTAWNRALTTWFPDPASFAPADRNLVLWAFTDDLEHFVRDTGCFRRTYIGWVHLAHAGRPDDPRLAHLVDRLQDIPAAQELWSEQHIAGFTNGITPVHFTFHGDSELEEAETDLLNIEFPGGDRLIMIVPRNGKDGQTGQVPRLIPRENTPAGSGALTSRPDPAALGRLTRKRQAGLWEQELGFPLADVSRRLRRGRRACPDHSLARGPRWCGLAVRPPQMMIEGFCPGRRPWGLR